MTVFKRKRCSSILVFMLLLNLSSESEGFNAEAERAWGPADLFIPERSFKREDGAAKDQDANGRYIGDFNQDCVESTTITKSKGMQIEPEDEVLKTANTKCHWNAIGTETCKPLLTCKKFKLAPDTGKSKDDKCPDEYLEVTDGVGGYDKFCGDAGPNQVTSTNDLRDLYVTLKTGAGTKRQLKCELSCAKGGEGTPLSTPFNPSTSETCNCGRKPNSDRIVGGEDAIRGEFPWMAGLVSAKTRKPFCGGTVINDRFIITAAHCFKGPYVKKENIQILLGGHYMDLTSAAVASGQGGSAADNFEAVKAEDVKQNSVRFSLEKYIMHPLYVRQTNDYDIALIQLSEPIKFDQYPQVKPACFPAVASYKDRHQGKQATVAGWGLNSSDSTATMGTLQKLDVAVFSQKECLDIFTDRFTDRMMCAGFKEAGKDSCKGDSGGPLISERKAQLWEIIGAVSWGESCAASNSPGVYLRINEVEQWVRYMTNDNDAVWCVE